MDIERVIGAGAPDRAVDEEAPPSIVINPHSETGKELRKWEQHYSELTPRGTKPGNPFQQREYPRMLYRTARHPSGQMRCYQAPPDPFTYADPQAYARELEAIEAFNTRTYLVVKDEAAHAVARGQGWCESIADAVADQERREHEAGQAAAEAAYAASRMSAGAKREYAAAGEATHEHVVDVRGRSRRRSHKKKAQAVTAAGPVEG